MPTPAPTPLRPAALVTGGSNGIGAAIVARILSRVVPVVILDRVPPQPDVKAHFLQADLTDEAATRRALAEITATYEIRWLVNNAGVAVPASLVETRMEDFERIIAVNLRATILCAQAVVPAMQAARFGRIVNITSRAALGKELRTSYSAAKAGIIGLTRTWALELGADGITVNAIGPGPIATDLFRKVNPADSPRTKRIIAGIPVKRLGEPEDIAHAVDFFLSDGASFVTGQTLFVCGGLSVGEVGDS